MAKKPARSPATVEIQNVECIKDGTGSPQLYRVRGEVKVQHLNGSEGDVPEHVQSVTADVDGSPVDVNRDSSTPSGPVTTTIYSFESESPQPSTTFTINASARITMEWDEPAEEYRHDCP